MGYRSYKYDKLIYSYSLLTEMEEDRGVCVVVLGDIGRSPRMQYHALSLARHGYKVDMVGYGETDPINDLKLQPNVSFHYLAPYPTIPIKMINYVIKTVWQFVTLLFVLNIIRRPKVLLVQNPPAVPALLTCYLFAKIVNAKLVVDWHNYTYSIMALSLNSNHALVKMAKKVEFFVGKQAGDNFCVTNAMKADLRDIAGIRFC